MNRQLSFLRNAALSLGVLAGAATAQDFDGQVTQDPRAGTATYDFHFQGPPRGYAFMFLSPWTAPFPLPLPGIGNFYLDPRFYFPLATIPMDLQGNGRLQLVLPLQIAQIGLVYQPLFVDPNLNLRLIYTIGFDVSAQPTFDGKWNSKTGEYCFRLSPVQQNDDIRITVDSREVFQGRAKQNGEMRGCFRHPTPFKAGTQIKIYKNSKLWKTIQR